MLSPVPWSRIRNDRCHRQEGIIITCHYSVPTRCQILFLTLTTTLKSRMVSIPRENLQLRAVVCLKPPSTASGSLSHGGRLLRATVGASRASPAQPSPTALQRAGPALRRPEPALMQTLSAPRRALAEEKTHPIGPLASLPLHRDVLPGLGSGETHSRLSLMAILLLAPRLGPGVLGRVWTATGSGLPRSQSG